MHILMIAPQPFFRPRGTPFSVLHRIRALLRLGHTVDLVTYPFGDSPKLDGLRIYRSQRPPLVRDVAIGPSVAKIALDVPLFLKARRLASNEPYDLLHTHEEAGILGARLGRVTGIRHLYDMHSSLPQQFANFGRYNWRPVIAMFERTEQFMLDGADGVIAICPELRDRVLQRGYSRPLALIENTLDFEPPTVTPRDVARLRRDLGVNDAPAIAYTGTLESYQGLDLLLESAPVVLGKCPAAQFVIVGGREDQIEELRALARSLEVGPAFHFVPTVPPSDVFLYQQAADVLVTTRAKGTNTPLKVYQYLRAGKPIVATRIRSHTQVFDDKSAELVDPSPSAIGAGLARVLSDPVRAQRLAAGAGDLAQREYSEDVYMSRLDGLLRQIMDTTQARSTG